MSDVFISYARKDRKTAQRLAEALENQGWSAWWDRIILPGKSFDKMIEDALTASRCVVVLWSAASRESDWVKNEARFGHEQQVLIPALIENVKPPFEFLHIHAASLIDWHGDTSHPGYHQLVAAIADHAGAPPKLEDEVKRKVEVEEARKKAEAAAGREAQEQEARKQAEKAETQKKAEAEAKRKAKEQEARRRAEEGAEPKKAEAEKPQAKVPPAERTQTRQSNVKWIVAVTAVVVLGVGLAVVQLSRPPPPDELRVEVEKPPPIKEALAEPARKEPDEPVVEALDAELVALSNVNVRDGPGVEYGKVSTLARGSSVKVTGHTDDWYRVVLAGVRQGYVFKELLGEGPAPWTDQPGETFKDCDVCPEMVIVRAGEFLMGSPDTDKNAYGDEKPLHEVTIAKPFAVGVYEVTFAEWDACAEAGGCNGYRPDDRGWGRGRRPVIKVGWNDARAYVKWLSGKTGKDYRLLTEAEWEYVARAGTETRYWWGDEIGTNSANCSSCGSQWDGKRTAPVGSFMANPFGLYDVHGNVWEWVADCYEADAYKTQVSYPAMVGALQQSCDRVRRGGSWSIYPKLLQSANRGGFYPGNRDSDLGFRVAQTL